MGLPDTFFIGAIGMFGGNFAPRSWAFCSGQLLPINNNTSLFAILGTTYGGDGRTTFGLPDLRGRVPIHVGGQRDNGPGLSSYVLGGKGGREQIQVLPNNLSQNIQNKQVAIATSGETQEVTVAEASSGGMVPIDTRPPFLGINYCIALQGIFPSKS